VKWHRIGRTDVYASELGFGGAPIGDLYEPVPDEDAAAAVRTAWEGGVRYFDTAPHYGLGLSERRLGAALRDRPRDEFVISTKVGRLLVANPASTGSDLAAGGFTVPDDLTRERDYSRDGVRRSLDRQAAPDDAAQLWAGWLLAARRRVIATRVVDMHAARRMSH
jgi:D-threo-aldose 1-dehydrogenase